MSQIQIEDLKLMISNMSGASLLKYGAQYYFRKSYWLGAPTLGAPSNIRNEIVLGLKLTQKTLEAFDNLMHQIVSR